MEQRDVAGREFSRSGLVVGIIVLLVAAVGLGGALWFGAKLQQQAQSPEGIAESILKDRKGAPFFEALRDNYPKEFADYTALLSRRVREGATREQIRAESFIWMQATTQRHLDEFVQAPHGDLNLYRQMEIQLVETMQQEDVRLCGQYAMGTLRPGTRYPPQTAERLIEVAASWITASAGGRDHPADRKIPKGDISEADAVALVTNMRHAGMSQTDLEVWTDPARMARARPEQQCAIGLYLLKGIVEMPHAPADRVTGWLASQKLP
ncbi:hypothetical protein HNP52_003582 [Sphingomonas kyeonggiensis]|uniref:Uncharacterized protein n=1 Tax=Sphingomonas kyeonggiensis TaxID=1268553 RepID=A0A7W7K518_9SPHN|nr:hypothetical protein [Sphingomonas kyeonggiensis]MBB4840490.1 hypothetical protein [Sphingomonas kyeonggiensis]